MFDFRYICGLRVYACAAEDALRVLKQRFVDSNKTILLFANSNLIIKSQGSLDWLNGSDVIVLNDGLALDFASFFIYGCQFPENLNGTDFCPRLLDVLCDSARVVLVGGEEGVGKCAASFLQNTHGVNVVGVFDGFRDLQGEGIISSINKLDPNVILVGLGNPLQENWIRNNILQLNSALVVGVGAFLDFSSQKIKRCPKWMRKFRLEWLYRLFLEPGRLGRRYTFDMAHFLYLVFLQRLKS